MKYLVIFLIPLASGLSGYVRADYVSPSFSDQFGIGFNCWDPQVMVCGNWESTVGPWHYRYICPANTYIQPSGTRTTHTGDTIPDYTCSTEYTPPPPVCETNTIPGGPINGGFGSGIYDVSGCAYSCGTNYSKLDGNTSMYDAQECTGIGQQYVSPDPSDYSGSPESCTIKTESGCLDMDSQPNGSCPVGTTYGRVNDKEVCVHSGTSTDPLDPGSQGLPDQGGDMQAEGTPDRAGTGGSPTGTGTGSSSGTSTTTDNGDGTSTTVSTETKETNGPSTVAGHGDPASWWESQYPDGAAGIASKFSEDVGNGPFMAMLNPLKSLPDGGTAPSWSLDFGIGQMGNYGSHSFELPAGVWAFVRFAILFTTVMTVRKLIFGG